MPGVLPVLSERRMAMRARGFRFACLSGVLLMARPRRGVGREHREQCRGDQTRQPTLKLVHSIVPLLSKRHKPKRNRTMRAARLVPRLAQRRVATVAAAQHSANSEAANGTQRL